MNSSPSRKVVFFFPAFSSQEATAPLGILAVSTPLLRAGYEVRIIDSTITPNFHKRTLDELDDALCLAISLVTGPMIRETVQIARAAKKRYPDKPVILGGWHPSLLPDQTLAAEYVDIVVKGQGEDALLEIVQAHRSGRIDEGHRGRGLQGRRQAAFSTRRARSSRFANCRRRPITWPISTLTSASAAGAGRCTRRAWPVPITAPTARTTASTDASGTRSNPNRWWKKPRDLVTRYGLSLLWIVDDNFLVDRERAVGIAEGLGAPRREVRLEHSGLDQPCLALQRGRTEAAAARRAFAGFAGRRQRFAKVMHLMNKDFQKIETIYTAADKLTQAGIRPSFNMIFGFPGEGENERRESIALIMDVCRRLSGRRILDQHLYAVSGLADHAAGV